MHLMEIHDTSWCPDAIRSGMRGVLQQVSSRLPGYEAAAEPLMAAMAECGTTEVLDLCAGAGGPWVRMLPKLQDDPRITRVQLTDLYPDLPAMEAMQAQTGGLVQPSAEPVNALAVPRENRAFRTCFNAFHHFGPDDARRVLADAVEAGVGIGIFELSERRLPALAFIGAVSMPLTWGLLPRVRPLKPAYLPLTYLLPIIPLVLTFDGLVSCLRTYHPEELLAMAQEVAPHYRWTAGRARSRGAPLHIVSLIGVPPEASS